eukprot:TRINITY_DN19055_c0_g1_i1.p1 TRINITY_DN19055_c0_g1~~TRINITY_DN19055_c0_g1_i1.p1  ORF type:complete len:378 (-),score=67.27 TRINITY_DN19055_c0_g1_i1:49-1182(-)
MSARDLRLPFDEQSRRLGSREADDKKGGARYLAKSYEIECQLGEGTFSTVWRVREKATGQLRAMKRISFARQSEDSTKPRNIGHEMALMRLVRHPNVVRCHHAAVTADHVELVVDLFGGGDMIDGLNAHRKDRGRIPDAQLANLARQMLAAVIHVHSCCIVHRDVKGENFLTDRPDIGDPDCVVALSDFGTAVKLNPGVLLNDKVGTPLFWAPEMIDAEYDFLVDVWALGVTVFLLLSAQLPFKDEAEITKPAGPDELVFKPPRYASEKCTDFMSQCLIKDPRRRPQALEVAKHPWMDTPKPPPPAGRGVLGSAMNWLGSLAGTSVAICACFGGICIDMVMKPVEKTDRVFGVNPAHVAGEGEEQAPEEQLPETPVP